MANRIRTRLPALLAVALMLALPVIGASRDGDEHDHDRARQALEAGEILPLRTILERVERDHPGQIMEVELEHEGAGWMYEIKVLRSGGNLVKLRIDARDGKVRGINQKNGENHRRGEDR